MKNPWQNWSTKKKAAAGTAVALVAVLGIWLGVNGNKPVPAPAVRTVTLHPTTLRNTVQLTGTVVSAYSTGVAAPGPYRILEVRVKVGDHVAEGDVLAQLDASDLQSQLNQQYSALSGNIAAAQTNFNNAQQNYNDAYERSVNAEDGVAAARTAMIDAQAKMDAAAASIANYQIAYTNAQLTVQNAAIAEKEAAAAFAAANAADQAAQTALNADPTNAALIANKAQTAAQLAAATAALTTAKTNLAAAIADSNAKKTELTTVQLSSGYLDLSTAYKTAQATYTQLRAQLDSYEAQVKATKSSLTAAADALKRAKTSGDLSGLRQKIADCTVKATSTGVITAANATVGGLAAGNLFSIQDTQHVQIDADVGEADVQRIAKGMPVVIKSDATGQKEIEGAVFQIAPTAGTAAGGTQVPAAAVTGANQSATFQVKIDVPTPGSGLLIGMNAIANVVMEERKGVYAVPFDALEKDANGATVIYTKQQDGNFAPLPVATGITTDYYTEIKSDALADGMVVRAGAGYTPAASKAPGVVTVRRQP